MKKLYITSVSYTHLLASSAASDVYKRQITFCLLLVSLCIHAQMISGIIVDEKNSR